MNRIAAHILRTLVAFTMVLATFGTANAGNSHKTDWPGIIHFFKDTTRYPLYDRRGDPYSYPGNGFDLRDTSFIKRTIEYDPKTKQYYIVEKIGDHYYRTPTSFTMEEFLRLQGKKDEDEYFRKRAAMLANMNRRIFKPKIRVTEDLFNRIVGTGKIDIRPSGYVDLLAGYQGQNIKNPTLPERARKNGGLDFNMNSQLQVDANIGDKLKLPINYNTFANFNFENQLKLDYHGKDDEIIKVFQAGNTSFASKGTLIPGAQSLFGLKTQLQFGKLYITTVLANMQSQRQTAALQGGTAAQTFTVKADEYDENRHFLFAQYFRNNYNKAMSQLPVVNSLVQVLKVEVWVTNRNGATTDTRDVIGFMDLGEPQPYQPGLGGGGGPTALPNNYANNLYNLLYNSPNARNSSLAQSTLTAPPFNLSPVQDFEKTFARKLANTDYYFNPQIGFLSLNQPLQPDEVLGVAYQYTYNGKVFQVGEFSQDVPPDTTGTTQRVLFLKLLKATSQRTNLPIWDLMMKNVYSVGYGQLERQDFRLDITYEEPSFGDKRYLPADSVLPPYKGAPIISLVNLDRLNNQLDPQPDGIFDFIEGFTIISSQSRVVFPVLEPFGHDLDYVYPDQSKRNYYLYYPLYDTIKAIAQTYANLNRFKITGRSKSSGTSSGNNGFAGGNTGGFGNASSGEYQLGYNIPRGSVTVTANGQILQENIDYEINYDLGTLRVTNAAILNSGVPVNIQYENNQAFGFQQRNFMAMRLDYLASKKLSLGATIVKLGERPFFIKQSYGDDPIRNAMYGIDIDYRNDIPRLTKWLDKLPFYSTKTMSSLTAYAEAAYLDPGHPKQINSSKKDKGGQVYVDDFEGTRSNIDLRFPLISWTLASIPQGNNNAFGTAPLFPESALNNNLESGYNRAKTSWYNIEPVLQEKGNANNPYRNNLTELSKPEVRQVLQREIFPKRSTQFGEGLLTTFDLAFFPRDRGPYNFNVNATANSSGVDPNGRLLNPASRWGGLMRNIDQTDFETANIEFIEFWLQDPFISPRFNPAGGKLYFNLGNISEDVLRDGKRLYENGLPTPTINAPVDNNTVWGRVPSNPLQVTNAFSNEPDDRQFQDVGLDGLKLDDEKVKFANYIAAMQVAAPGAYQRILGDPSGDNFVAYRDAIYDQTAAGILDRYKQINNPDGNSPVSNANSEFINAFTQYPDAEELNRDNTMNEVEEYFQYMVDIKPNMAVGTNFITDIRRPAVTLADGTTRTEQWYLFRIPISQYQVKVGNIPDFKSIRFLRMFATGFSDSVVMRFGKLELVRNQWRKFKNKIDTTGQFVNLPVPDPTNVNTLAVNIEENDQRQPIPYRIPPGIERQQQLSNNNVALFLNEQALSVRVCGLQKSEARGVFKTMNLDMRQYKRMQMFIHAESVAGSQVIADGVMFAVIRIGSDFSGNYYEIRIPLKITLPGETDSLKIWPEVNNLDFDLGDLTKLKMRRNKAGFSTAGYYKETLANGRTYAIVGNPNLGEVRGMLLAVENPFMEVICTEVWFNELRLSQLDENGGWAALARMDLRLADLGGITLSATGRTRGFGTLEQRVNERSREDVYTLDITGTIEASKLLPKKWGLQIPVYAGYSRTSSTPEYDPYDLDLKLKEKLKDADASHVDSIRNDAQDITTIKTFNLTNVKKLKTDGKRPMPWSVTNFDFNYSYIQTLNHNPLIERDEMRRTRGALGYTYAPQVRSFEPFKKLKTKSPWLALIKDFNINYVPNQIAVKADVFRQFGATQVRNVGGGPYKIPETYNKFFTFDRYYILQWNLTRSISIDFNAVNFARIDEPFGRIDTKEEKDSIHKNLYKGGRNTNYRQDVTVRYTVPMQKIPFLNWTSLTATYNAKYNWLAASLLARAQGNILSNTQTKTITGELKFEELYNKSRFLRAVNTNNPKQPAAPKDPNNPTDNKKDKKDKNKKDDKDNGANVPGQNPQQQIAPGQVVQPQPVRYDTIRNKQGKIIKIKKIKQKKVKKKKDPNRPLPEIGDVPKFFLQMATSLKRVGIQYTEDFGTTLPGYMDSTNILGNNFKSGQPGFGYIFGYQPDTSWINRFGQKGLLSRDALVTAMIQQRYNQRLGITAQVTPFRDFNIDINLDKTFDKQYSELYKDTLGFQDPNSTGLSRLNPYALGSFNVSYIAFQTLFKKFDPNQVSETFLTFENNRAILAAKLAGLNPYGAAPDPNDPGYYKGYGRYAQDVIIPAFIAAYTNKDPNKVSIASNANPNIRANPFAGIKAKPNWTVTYNGLTRLPGMDKIFTSFTLRHGYHSTFSMNSFNTALLFADPFHIGYPFFRDTLTGNYIPYFLVPNITIQESFDPLIGIEMTFVNQLSARFEYKKSRTLTLSLIDYQLAQNQSTEITFGLDWRRKGVPLIKKLPFMKGNLDNDVTFRMDFSLRDDATANSKLDQKTSFGTAGQKVIRIAPSIDYVVNNRVSIKLYFEQNRNIPKISNSFPITNTRGGVQVRISLTQ